MGADEDSSFWLLAVSCLLLAGDDIRAFKDGAVVAFQVGLLQLNLIAILTKLLLYPFAATLVGLAIHGTGAEVALGSTESVGRIGIELDADYCLLSCLTLLGCAA